MKVIWVNLSWLAQQRTRVLFFQLAQDKLDFFPLDRAMSLLGQDEDEKDTRLDDLMETLREIKEKQDREVPIVICLFFITDTKY